jgi:hypothetical protein
LAYVLHLINMKIWMKQLKKLKSEQSYSRKDQIYNWKNEEWTSNGENNHLND